MEPAGEIASPSGVVSHPPGFTPGNKQQESREINSRGVLDSPQHSPLTTFHWTNSAVFFLFFFFKITEQAENKPLIYVLFLIRPSQKTDGIHMGKEDPLADLKRCWSRKQAWGKQGLDRSLAGPPVEPAEGWRVYERSSWMPAGGTGSLLAAG